MSAVIVPDAYDDKPYRTEMLMLIQNRIDEHPRSAQIQVGPSEIGGCETKLAWKLSYGGDSEREGGWAAHKGSVLHSWLDCTFKATDRFMPDGGQRFYSDLKVASVSPHVNGGTLDLYDRLIQRVIDWKLPGEYTMKAVRSGKLSAAYYVQAQTYGYGMEQAGFPVRSVALMFLPMCGDDLHGMARGAILRVWDYDPTVAPAAIGNVARIKNMLDVSTPQRVMEVLTKTSDFCSSCSAFIGNGDRRAICPGVMTKPIRQEIANPFA